MADETPKNRSDINFDYNSANSGLNMDNTPSQVPKGSLTYALNAALENYDSNSVNYQNEPGNELCLNFPENYVVIGRYFISEQSKHIFFLSNPTMGKSEIGYMLNNDCLYHTIINADCLNFDQNFPIHKVVHKTNNCDTEIYWAQPNADRRYLNLDKIPYLPMPGSTPCDENLSNVLDCNQLRVQPNYSIPQITVMDVIIGGNLIAGVYQFGVQYSDALGNPLSSVHSITNPTPIADPQFATVNFDYPVGKSIILNIDNIELGGQFDFFNLVVIKTINAISSVELVGTYQIDGESKTITYAGQNQTLIRLTMNDVFEKFPLYGPADDVTTVQDILVWKGLSSPERVSYQKIANQISLLWETVRIPATKNYSDELVATNYRGYLRDEVYPFEFVPLLRSGKQADGFHIPGRAMTLSETTLPDIDPSNDDYIEDPKEGPVAYWRIYNTGVVLGTSEGYLPDAGYEGPYQYGLMAYWESEDTYPCDEAIWGDLANQKIRHHKFPDVLVSPIIESKVYSAGPLQMGNDAVFPIGVRIDEAQIKALIFASDLTPEQKADVIGFKIVRGDRTNNRSIVAKGILRNVGKYTREKEDFYYANYPYNDLNADPFLNAANNAWTKACEPYNINVIAFNAPANNPTYLEVNYTDCNTNKALTQKYYTLGLQKILCSTTVPILLGTGVTNDIGQSATGPFPHAGTTVLISIANYDVYKVGIDTILGNGYHAGWNDIYLGAVTQFWVAGFGQGTPDYIVHVTAGTSPVCEGNENQCYPKVITKLSEVRVPDCKVETPIPPIKNNTDLAYRQIFNSPETSFGQPFLGDVLKAEAVMFGKGQAHFVEVKDNAKYRLLTAQAQRDAVASADDTAEGNMAAFFAAYQAYLTIYINGITRKNYAQSFNSIADYNYSVGVPNNLGVKQRRLDLKKYLIPVVQNVGETNPPININNHQRETSVYLRTEGSDDKDPAPLPFPSDNPAMASTPVVEHSRFTIGCSEGTEFCTPSCATPADNKDISVVSYYASLKTTFRSQWGQIYTYDTIDTGFQVLFDSEAEQPTIVFGGDTFISRFAFKTKLPFFIDNRVGSPDDSDIFYDEIGNVGYPKFWHSARSILESVTMSTGTLVNFISYKAHNFDCYNQIPVPPIGNPNRTFYDGYYYLFAYGIPYFYVETSYNTDLRQAFNNEEGDFWPHVSNSIPDDWVQESFVSILNDNTYYYNTSFSKQNRENLFTHLPANWEFVTCNYIFPFRAIFSDPQNSTADTTVNNWLTYRASAYFDFPQNFGALVSLDGIENKQVLARFENKSLLYNALYTTQTNTNGQVYLGQPLFSKTNPPLDFAETDLGYIGSQHKFLLKIPQGQISVDAKRGQVFLLNGSQGVKDLSLPGSGMNRFFTDHLDFAIKKYFPDINIDNNFKDVGLCGVYDNKYDRVLITKKDYIPLSPDVKYDSVTKEFYIEEIPPTTTTSSTTSGTTTSSTTSLSSTTSTTTIAVPNRRIKVDITNTKYFCNVSWTLSYSLLTNSWISFHSYLPNYYMGENNFFYTGIKSCCVDFDYIAGGLVPNPPTTTTTSSSTSSTTSTTSTTTTLNCTLVGTVVLTQCALAGTGVITVPPVCRRPANLNTLTVYSGYSIITPPSTVSSTLSFSTACNAKNFIFNNSSNVIPLQVSIRGISLNVGNTMYVNNSTQDCSVIANGFYYTTNPAEPIYEIVNGVIVNTWFCNVNVSTTTTTSTTCSGYAYTVRFATCAGCIDAGAGSIVNATPLTVNRWYYNPVLNIKMLVAVYNGCGTPIQYSILNSTQKNTCAEVICGTTTTTTTT